MQPEPRSAQIRKIRKKMTEIMTQDAVLLYQTAFPSRFAEVAHGRLLPLLWLVLCLSTSLYDGARFMFGASPCDVPPRRLARLRQGAVELGRARLRAVQLFGMGSKRSFVD